MLFFDISTLNNGKDKHAVTHLNQASEMKLDPHASY